MLLPNDFQYICFGCKKHFQIEEGCPPPKQCPLCNHEHVAKMTFISGPPWLDCFEEFLDFSKEIWKSREFGIIAPIIGLLLIVFGIVQWTSLVSQSMRAFGGIDTLAISLFVGGILVLLLGSFSLASSRAVSNTKTTIQISIEDRLRQLDDLRSKNLISDIEYEERRKNIIAAA